MNRYEQAVNDCMIPTAKLVSQIHREQPAALERERGDKFWVLDAG